MVSSFRQGSDAGFSFVPAFLSNSPSSSGSYPGATLAGTLTESRMEDFCFMREHHGDTKGGRRSLEHAAWHGIIQRCHNPNNPDYASYGGRGICVYKEWRNSYSAFLAYVGRKPSPNHSLDRYPDQNGNYEPGNVRWATQKEQTNNMRSNHFITIAGQTRTLTEWGEISGINITTILARLNRGWAESEILRPPSPLARAGHHRRNANGCSE